MDPVTELYEKTSEITEGAPRSQVGTSACTSLHTALKNFSAKHRMSFGAAIDMAIYKLLIDAQFDFSKFKVPDAAKKSQPEPRLKWLCCNQCTRTFRQPLDQCPYCGSREHMVLS